MSASASYDWAPPRTAHAFTGYLQDGANKASGLVVRMATHTPIPQTSADWQESGLKRIVGTILGFPKLGFVSAPYSKKSVKPGKQYPTHKDSGASRPQPLLEPVETAHGEVTAVRVYNFHKANSNYDIFYTCAATSFPRPKAKSPSPSSQTDTHGAAPLRHTLRHTTRTAAPYVPSATRRILRAYSTSCLANRSRPPWNRHTRQHAPSSSHTMSTLHTRLRFMSTSPRLNSYGPTSSGWLSNHPSTAPMMRAQASGPLRRSLSTRPLLNPALNLSSLTAGALADQRASASAALASRGCIRSVAVDTWLPPPLLLLSGMLPSFPARF
jgi:hypothetical protein